MSRPASSFESEFAGLIEPESSDWQGWAFEPTVANEACLFGDVRENSQAYPVGLRWRGDDVVLHCGCTTFQDTEACPHLLVLFREADSTRPLRRPNGFTALVYSNDPSCEYTSVVDGTATKTPEVVAAAVKPQEPITNDGKGVFRRLARQTSRATTPSALFPNPVSAHEELVYVVHPTRVERSELLPVDVLVRKPREMLGGFSYRPIPLARFHPSLLANELDQELLAVAQERSLGTQTLRLELPVSMWPLVLPKLVATGRFFLAMDRARVRDGEPSLIRSPDDFELRTISVWARASQRIEVEQTDDGVLVRSALLQRVVDDEDAARIDVPLAAHAAGAAFMPNGALLTGELDLEAHRLFANDGLLVAATEYPDVLAWVGRYAGTGSPIQARFVGASPLAVEPVDPVPTLHFRDVRGELVGTISFSYRGTLVSAADPSAIAIEESVLYPRSAKERELLQDVSAIGLETRLQEGELVVTLTKERLIDVSHALLSRGWDVRAPSSTFIKPTATRFRLERKVDWFEVEGGVSFGRQHVGLPALLQAVRAGQRFVTLANGQFGLVSDDMRARLTTLIDADASAETDGDVLRVAPRNFGFAVALAEELGREGANVALDDASAALRDRLALGKLAPTKAPDTFHGTLREYQEEALSWFSLWRELGTGGVLADDMGLGKTVQVLALIAGRALEGGQTGTRAPSLVVAPRSLVFNWKNEAQRFAPSLRVLDLSTSNRVSLARATVGKSKSTSQTELVDAFANADLVVATYGTMKRDIDVLRQTQFDYVVLDEATNIKNPRSESAQAASLLRARHRLVLTGTPIENHVGELGSLFTFLQDAGVASGVDSFSARFIGHAATVEGRGFLRKALRPYLLRRTKKEVALELPQKTESIIAVDLEGPQRALYDELREYYRAQLQGALGDAEHAGRAKFAVLEALLRLRQAACHPALIDAKHNGMPVAKVDALMPRLQEIHASGQKVLVFSQFTSFLALIRDRLTQDGIPYSYLDGQTRERERVVSEFENDPTRSVFLVSLKAGGFGLNLTAAQYVFLLDPWWNPAVEAQAIDRAHRIGQQKPVFAYRIVAKDTVEEKVLALQQEKKKLADDLLGSDESLLASLSAEDLVQLFI